MRTLLFTALLLCSSVALGQTTTPRVQIQFPNQTGDTLSVGSGDCGLTRSVSWTVATGTCDALTLWATRDADCADKPSSQTAGSVKTLGTISTSTLATQTTGTVTFNVSELPFPGGDGGATCGGTGFEQSFQVCASTRFTETLSCSSTYQKSSLELIYDALAPSKPTVTSVAGLDSGLSITVTAPSDATRLLVEVLRDGAVVGSGEQASGNNTFRIRQLTNGVAHEVRAYALDDVGNRSESSDPMEGTPVNTRGFYEEYLESGGQESGGCGAAGGGGVGSAVLAVMGLWLFSRRGRS